MLPFSNATLTAVASEQFVAEGARDETSVPRWTGEERAYYQEKRERWRGTTDTELHLVRFLYIDSATDDLVGKIADDDQLTFTFEGDTMTGHVDIVERRRLPGHPLQTTRVTLRVE